MRELTEKLEQARVYFDKANTAHAAPERLPYVNVPKTREEREQARKIAAAVGDAQVCACEYSGVCVACVCVRVACVCAGVVVMS